MDIEKLIKRLKCPQIQSCPMDGEYPSCKACQKSIQKEAATALSTLQGENKQLRGELEYEQEHANAYHEECGQWEAENEKLRAKLEQVKIERDAAVECIGEIEDALKFQRISAIGLRISEWRNTKED